MRYESEVLYDLMKRDGLLNPSQEQLPYESELKEKYVDEVKGAYPKVTDYRPEWLNYNLGYYIPADFPTESLVNVTSGTVNNVIPYAYKSAILTGNTLVNLMITGEKTKTATGSYVSMFEFSASFAQELKPNTQYLYIMDIIETTLVGGDNAINIGNTDSNQLSAFINQAKFPADSKGMLKCVLTTRDSFDGIFAVLRNQLNGNATSGSITYRQMLIEYQQGMENWDIPYFEGMKSVQMPVLTTTGKNLFDKSKVKYNTTIIAGNGQEEANNLYMSSDYISVNPNETYTSNKMGVIFYYDKDKQYVGELNKGGDLPKTFTTPTNCKYIRVRCWAQYSGVEKQKEVVELEQLEKGSTATSYEPFKSNILTVNEPVELGSVGEVKDELNLLTQQLTQRTETRPYQEGDELNSEFVTDMTNTRYKLAQEVVKTVDLTSVNQDGVPSTFRPFEGTMHIKTDGEPLKPLLDMEIPVEATTQNLASFVNLEGVERTVNEYVEDEEIIGDGDDEQLL